MRAVVYKRYRQINKNLIKNMDLSLEIRDISTRTPQTTSNQMHTRDTPQPTPIKKVVNHTHNNIIHLLD